MPASVVLLAALPKTSLGKIDKDAGGRGEGLAC
jgi:non-ribosomal peptide synthetase component E (peptide arylation enzyme)